MRKFSASSLIRDYRIRNFLPVELDSGLDGYLYYASMIVEGVELMQMHVVASSAKHHFIMTFTDLASHFETGDEASPYLDEAWKVFGSVTLASSGPSRFGFPLFLYSLIALVVAGGVGFSVLRNRKAKEDYDAFSKQTSFDDDLQADPQPESVSGHGHQVTIKEAELADNTGDEEVDDSFKDDYLDRRAAEIRKKAGGE